MCACGIGGGFVQDILLGGGEERMRMNLLPHPLLLYRLQNH